MNCTKLVSLENELVAKAEVMPEVAARNTRTSNLRQTNSMMSFDEIFDYVQTRDYVVRDDDSKTMELAVIIYNETFSRDLSLDEIDDLLARIHEEARFDRFY